MAFLKVHSRVPNEVFKVQGVGYENIAALVLKFHSYKQISNRMYFT